METFKFIQPTSVLTPFIRHYWILETETSFISERVVPIGCVQMVFHRGDRMFSFTDNELQSQVFIGGQSIGYRDLQATGKVYMIAVVFQPHGLNAFFRIPANEFYNGNISVSDLSDKGVSALEDVIMNTQDNNIAIQLIEEFFISRLYNFDSYNYKRISVVLNKIDKECQPDIKTLANVACLSYKQFGRIFNEYVGMMPKEFLRIVRFQKALYILQNLSGINQAELAAECGFYDQSHLIKEFKQFSGYTPNEYITLCEPYSDYFSQI